MCLFCVNACLFLWWVGWWHVWHLCQLLISWLIFTTCPHLSYESCSRSARPACWWQRLLLLAPRCLPIWLILWLSYMLGKVVDRYHRYLWLLSPNRRICEFRLSTKNVVCPLLEGPCSTSCGLFLFHKDCCRSSMVGMVAVVLLPLQHWRAPFHLSLIFFYQGLCRCFFQGFYCCFPWPQSLQDLDEGVFVERKNGYGVFCMFMSVLFCFVLQAGLQFICMCAVIKIYVPYLISR